MSGGSDGVEGMSTAEAVMAFGERLASLSPQRHDHHHTETKTIVEKRAPTDESVKLLREMEAAALAKIIDATRVGDTTFECVVHAQKDVVSDSDMYRVIFSLNGKRMTVDHTVRCIDMLNGVSGIRHIVDALIKLISEKIALEVVSPALGNIWRHK